MEQQQDLFGDEPLPPYQRHSETSREAAEVIAPKAGPLRAKVLDLLRSRGEVGATDEEIAEALREKESTVRARRIELTLPKYGHCLVKDSGTTRLTRGGNRAVVWVAV